MCVMLLKKDGRKLDKDIYHNCYVNNADGAGFAYIKNGKLRTVKGFFSFNEFWDNFAPYEEYARIVHFRVGTSGFCPGENCHPWRVNKDLVFAHNGLIPVNRLKQDWSDTGNYCEYVLKPLTESFPDWWKQTEFKYMMELALGSNNKVILLDKDGNSQIFNEKEGEWDDDVWYSNRSYLLRTRYSDAEFENETTGSTIPNRSGIIHCSKSLNELIANIDVTILDAKLAAANKNKSGN